MARTPAPEPETLDAFLARLDPEQAGEARAAAASIDHLSRAGDGIRGIERRFAPWAMFATAAFAAGVVLFFNPGAVPRTLVMALLAVLPGVGAAYAWKVRHRTRADNESEALNKAHFLPYNGLYFPPGERPACVMKVHYRPPDAELPLSQAPRDPRKGHDTKPGRIW